MEKSYGVIVFKIKAEEILFLLVKSKEFNFWGFPKGNFESAKDKSAKATAVRELREETGLSVEFIGGFRKTIKYFLSDQTIKSVTFFIGRAINDRIKLSKKEISASKWLNFTEAQQLLKKKNLKVLLRQAMNFLKKHLSFFYFLNYK